ncbi:hypothetical protein Vafri_13816 [Volvox africanus]|uniref:3'-5' exonuclease domain-containing protein n=1 Tax=Volvox africanus TaxID=51714 RepID=A0A8J4BHG3_9CHLO|nr:hypothetical protein Vafri_13816 [Volvox africanus]
MPLGAKQGGSKSRPAVLVGISAVAAAASMAVALVLKMRRRRRHVWPLKRFHSVFADTTDQPFPHLPPQPDDYDDGGIDAKDVGGAGGVSPAHCPMLQAAATTAAAVAVVDGTSVASGITAATDSAAAATMAPGTEGYMLAVAEPRARTPRQVHAGFPSAAPRGPLVHPYLARIQRLMGGMECPVLRRPPPPPPLPPPAGGPADVTPTHGSLPGFQIHWISNPKQLYSLGQRLRRVPQVGLDTESTPLLCYHGLVCLIQLSVWDGGGDGGRGGGSSSNGSDGDEGTVWLIDALALHDHVGPALGALMSDPRVVKVIHGGGNDVVWLQRDFRMYLVNVFDTEKASQVGTVLCERCACVYVGMQGRKANGERGGTQRAGRFVYLCVCMCECVVVGLTL